MTRSAVRCVQLKHQLYRKYRDNKHPLYTESAKQARRAVRKAKKAFEVKMAANIKVDNKSFFAYARAKSSTKPTVGPLLNAKGECLSSPSELAEELNFYFSSVFTTENMSNVPDIGILHQDSGQSGVLSSVIIQESTVLTKLLKLRADKSAGSDGISPKLAQ